VGRTELETAMSTADVTVLPNIFILIHSLVSLDDYFVYKSFANVNVIIQPLRSLALTYLLTY